MLTATKIFYTFVFKYLHEEDEQEVVRGGSWTCRADNETFAFDHWIIHKQDMIKQGYSVVLTKVMTDDVPF